jgi:hypothetical protein
VETGISLLHGGQQKNMCIRVMRMVKQIDENDVHEITLVTIMIIRRGYNKNKRRGKMVM